MHSLTPVSDGVGGASGYIFVVDNGSFEATNITNLAGVTVKSITVTSILIWMVPFVGPLFVVNTTWPGAYWWCASGHPGSLSMFWTQAEWLKKQTNLMKETILMTYLWTASFFFGTSRSAGPNWKAQPVVSRWSSCKNGSNHHLSSICPRVPFQP